MIKFNLYNVTDGTHKARVAYHASETLDGRKYVRLYEKGYSREMHKIFQNAVNNTDTMTDYFESSNVTIYEGDELYPAALAAAKRLEEKCAKRWGRR